jgi:hypothetical protein
MKKVPIWMTFSLKGISLATFFSGLVQMVFPGFVLGMVGGTANPPSLHFFRIVGMFMLLFGGLFFQALHAPTPTPITAFWCGWQKLGAATMISIGIFQNLFSPIALGVAGFDFISALLIAFYWNKIRA